MEHSSSFHCVHNCVPVLNNRRNLILRVAAHSPPSLCCNLWYNWLYILSAIVITDIRPLPPPPSCGFYIQYISLVFTLYDRGIRFCLLWVVQKFTPFSWPCIYCKSKKVIVLERDTYTYIATFYKHIVKFSKTSMLDF